MTAATEEAAAIPTLDGSDIATIAQLGTRRAVRAGGYLYRSGDEDHDSFVVAAGAVDIILEGNGVDDERMIARHGTGRFLGELNLLTGSRVFVSAPVSEAGVVVAVSSGSSSSGAASPMSGWTPIAIRRWRDCSEASVSRRPSCRS